MPRLVAISPEAERIMVREFHKRTPAAIVARLLFAEAGETYSERTVARRCADYRAAQLKRQTAREQISDLVSAMKQNDFTAAEMLSALATQALMDNPDKYTNADPLELQAQNLKAEELRLKAKQLELRERTSEMEEKKLEMLLAREAKAVAAAADLEKGAVTPDDFRRRIHEIYGLGGNDAEAHA